MDELRQSRKANGLCAQCGVKLDRKGRYCVRCSKLNNSSKHARVIRLHEENKCTSCGELMDRQGWFCKRCASNLKIRARERNLERRKNHLCVQCGRPTEGNTYCRRCLDMRMNRYHKAKKKETK